MIKRNVTCRFTINIKIQYTICLLSWIFTSKNKIFFDSLSYVNLINGTKPFSSLKKKITSLFLCHIHNTLFIYQSHTNNIFIFDILKNSYIICLIPDKMDYLLKAWNFYLTLCFYKEVVYNCMQLEEKLTFTIFWNVQLKNNFF